MKTKQEITAAIFKHTEAMLEARRMRRRRAERYQADRVHSLKMLLGTI